MVMAETETIQVFLQGSMWVTFANIPLAKETHMAKLRIKGQGNRSSLFSKRNYQITWQRSLDTGRNWSYLCNQSATSWQETH